MNEPQLRKLFTSILSGNSDIGSRMASSSPYASPPYPDRVNKIVSLLHKRIKQGLLLRLTEEQKRLEVDRYVRYCLKG